MDEGEALMVRGFLGGVEGVREIWFREGGVVMRVRASRLGILCESGGLARVEVCYLLETLK